MAGDLAINETLLVMPEGGSTRDAALLGALREGGGRVLVRYGLRVAILQLGVQEAARLRKIFPAVFAASGADLGDAVLASLDEIETLGATAFIRRTSPEFVDRKRQRPRDGEPWGGPETAPPDLPGQVLPEAAVYGDTSRTLTGETVVAHLAVSGPAELGWNASEFSADHVELQNGVAQLMAMCPPTADASITFHHGGIVFVDVEPPSPPPEKPDQWLWINAALYTMGYPPGLDGCYQLIENMKKQWGARWGYLAFFTKYPVEWFAYARVGGPYLVMSPDGPPDDKGPWGGWGDTNIDRIFAHETGHIFQALDEYAGGHSTSDCSRRAGIYNEPNLNSDACESKLGQDCLMKMNTWALCTYTPWHLGFPFPSSLPTGPLSLFVGTPASCVVNGKLVAFLNLNGVLAVMDTADGVTWSIPQPLGVPLVGLSPAVCAAGERMYVFFISPETGAMVYISGTLSGFSLTPVPVGEKVVSTQTPAACVFNGKIFLFWIADTEIGFTTSRDGKEWSAPKRINQVDVSPSTPAACVFNGKLYLFWRATNSTQQIYYSASEDGESWPSGKTINGVDATLNTVSACVIETGMEPQLYLFWKGFTVPQIYFTVSTDGKTWPGGVQINQSDTPAAAPCAVAFASVPEQPANPYLLFLDSNGVFRYTA